MAVTASSLIERVRSQLVDDGSAARWTDAELLRYLSDGQRTIAAISPSAAATRAVVELTEGTLQELPSDGKMLLRAIRNMGTDGTKPGRVIRLVSRELVDSQNPDWHALPKTTEVQSVMYDPQDEGIFYVYPPSNGNGQIQINYAINPPQLTAVDDTLTVADIYQTPLFDYTMWRAHMKDSEMSSPQMVPQYFEAFRLFMQVQDAGEKESSPNQELTPRNLNIIGSAQ
jgi:hypothetical protein